MIHPTSITVAFFVLFLTAGSVAVCQDNQMEPEETEVWEPVPPKVEPGPVAQKWPPSDAIVLLGQNSGLSQWQHGDGSAAEWSIDNGVMTVRPGTGGIQTKQDFGSVQLHVEWRAPSPAEGKGQDRGNSGVFLQNRYEVQVLDSYDNQTYSNGMAGSIYKQHIPRVNAARPPGEWQTYDIIFTAPEFNADGSVKTPAYLTVFWNGIMVHNKVKLQGPTVYIGKPQYEAYEDRAPIMLQDHNHPVSYRNIWVRELD